MTSSLTFPDPQHQGGGFDRRKILTGAAALGIIAGLSATTITRLTAQRQNEAKTFAGRDREQALHQQRKYIA